MRIRPSRSARQEAYFGTVGTADIGVRAARGSALTVSSQAIKLAATLGTLAVLARLLTPADYGLLAMLLTFTAFVTVFRDLGLSAATIQREQISEAQVSALFWLSLLTGCVLAALSLLLAPAASWFFDDARLTGAIAASSPAFVFAGASGQHLALLSRSLRFGAVAFADVGSLVAASSLGILLALAGAGYWSLVLMQPAIPFFQLCAVWLLAGWTPRQPARASGLRALVAFGGNLTGFNLLNYFARNGDNILIGRMYSPADLGSYTRAYSILLAPISQISTPLGSVAIPTLSRISANDAARYRRAYLRILGKLCIVTMPLVAFAIATSDWVVRLALGPQWDTAAQIFFFLGFAGLVEPIANTLGWLFITENRTRDLFRWSVYNLPLTIAAFVVGLPWGPQGVAASYACYSIIRMPVLFWYVGRKGPVRSKDFYFAAWPGALSAAATFATALALRYGLSLPNNFTSILLTGAAAGAAGLLTVCVFPAGREELRDLVRLGARILPG